jgi:hypothetical protein
MNDMFDVAAGRAQPAVGVRGSRSGGGQHGAEQQGADAQSK